MDHWTTYLYSDIHLKDKTRQALDKMCELYIMHSYGMNALHNLKSEQVLKR